MFHKEINAIQNTSNCIDCTTLSRKVKTTLTISECQTGNIVTHVLKPVYIPRALNMGTGVNRL